MSDSVLTKDTEAKKLEKEERRKRKQEKKRKRELEKQELEGQNKVQKVETPQTNGKHSANGKGTNGSTNGNGSNGNGHAHMDTERQDDNEGDKSENNKKDKKSKKRNREESEEPEKKKQKTSNDGASENGSNGHNNAKKFLATDTAKLEEVRSTHSIAVEGDVTNWKFFESFTEAGFSADLLECTKTFKQPTPIQAQCWPMALAGRDIVGIAETGSGKTLAFGLPGLSKISKNLSNKNPQILVLAPTRELAIQSSEVLITAGKSSKIKVLCMYGGSEKNPQKKALREGVNVVVATPGRLLDLINEEAVTLADVSYLVLDEADRMLDLGFERDIRSIISMIPKSRQTLMFSATWPQDVQKLAAQFLNNPLKVTIGSDELTANKNVQQIVEVIEPLARDERLIQLLSSYHKTRKNKVLVFVLYKKEATRVENFLRRKGWANCSIHGDKNQSQRLEALASFTSGTVPLLIATDVAARGLDIPKVEYVINYSFPLTIEDYVHRIGRTGRAGAKGISHTFFQQFDKTHAGELVQVLKESNQTVPEDLLKFGVAIKKKEPKLGKIQSADTSKHISFDSDEEDN